MRNLPWINIKHPQFVQLINASNGSKMLIDTQRKNADAMASLWTAYQLCLSKEKPCGHCQSCHLLKQETHPDSIFHSDACNIEKIRHIIDQIHTTPTIAPIRAVYLGSIDQYNAHAINALLKTLEEPPIYSSFLLSTSSRRAVKATILSRTQTFTLAKPTYAQSLNWLINEHHLSQAEAKRRLQIHADNPFTAIANKELPALESSIKECLEFLNSPTTSTNYLMQLEQLPSDGVVDFVEAQIGMILRYQHFNDIPEGIDHHMLNTLSSTLNMVNLHTLYAKLSTLRRPDKQQINPLLSVKSILLQTMTQRSLST